MEGFLFNIKFRYSQQYFETTKAGTYNDNLPFMSEPEKDDVISLMKLLRPSYENIQDIMIREIEPFDYSD